jgi:hypothetical protein
MACPSGTVNAGKTIVTMDCNTVVQYDANDLAATANVLDWVSVGLKQAPAVLRQVNDAATDAQLQFTQTCRVYNACQLRGDDFTERLAETQSYFRELRARVEEIKASAERPELVRVKLSELYTSSVPPEKRAEQTLSVDFVVQAKTAEADSVRTLKNGESLRSGAEVVFGLRVSKPAHVYLFQRNATDGAIDVLFPNAAITTLRNPIQPGTLVRVPPSGNVFTLDEDDIGTEHVYIAVSTGVLGDLEHALRTAQGKRQGEEELASAMGDLFAQGAPECRGVPRSLKITSKKGCGSLSRGLTLAPEKDDFFKGESSVRAQNAPGDDVILRTFTFEHLR